MIEKVIVFGEAKNLVGIVTQPADAESRSADLAFLILNAGVIHRIGPNRIHVKLARRLSAAGFPVLRFDLAGLGDSRPSQSTLSFEAQAVADVRAAMDFMEVSRAIRRFVIVGLCSGADNAYATARVDNRVLGIVMLDPYAYPTWKTTLRFQMMRAMYSIRRVKKLRHRMQRILSGIRYGEIRRPNEQRYVRKKPAIGEFAETLRGILDRGGFVAAMYTGSSLKLFNYERQIDDALKPFGLAGRIHTRLWMNANHTFTDLAAQSALFDAVVEWANEVHRRYRDGEASGSE